MKGIYVMIEHRVLWGVVDSSGRPTSCRGLSIDTVIFVLANFDFVGDGRYFSNEVRTCAIVIAEGRFGYVLNIEGSVKTHE